MQQSKTRSIWKQSETMDCLQQAPCQTVRALLLPDFLGFRSPETYWEGVG